MNGILETIIEEVKKHNEEHPDHGTGCYCMDKHSTNLRNYLRESGATDWLKNEKLARQVSWIFHLVLK